MLSGVFSLLKSLRIWGNQVFMTLSSFLLHSKTSLFCRLLQSMGPKTLCQQEKYQIYNTLQKNKFIMQFHYFFFKLYLFFYLYSGRLTRTREESVVMPISKIACITGSTMYNFFSIQLRVFKKLSNLGSENSTILQKMNRKWLAQKDYLNVFRVHIKKNTNLGCDNTWSSKLCSSLRGFFNTESTDKTE